MMNAPGLLLRNCFLMFLNWFCITSLMISCYPIGFLQTTNTDSSFIEEDTFSETQIFHSLIQQTGCSDFKNYVWNYMHKIISMGDDILYYKDFENTIRKRIKELLRDSSIPQKNINNFAEHFAIIYKLILDFKKNHQSHDNIKNRLIQIEYGDIDEDFSQFINQIKITLNNLVNEAKLFNMDCPKESQIHWSEKSYEVPAQWNIGWFDIMKSRLHPLVYGARKVMATAYQSCLSLDLPLMPNNQPTRGIKIVGQRGGGLRRRISNIKALNRSHYYLSQINIPDDDQCFNVYSTPLIYDYGGKPVATNRSIDLFKNKGGAPGLGLDCSGFVTTALASAGLRLQYGKPISPGHIEAVSSWLLKDPQRKNFSCLIKQHISQTNPLRPGDIIASNAHVIIVDEINTEDPFSIRHLKQCDYRKIKSDSFQFSIIQSNPENKGIGINRMQFSEATNYMKAIFIGMRKVASRICHQKWGQTVHPRISEVAILRHNLDKTQCRQQEIHLKHQECLKYCLPQSI